MPIPCSELKTEMMFLRELPLKCTNQADYQEYRTDYNVQAMESGCHKEIG